MIKKADGQNNSDYSIIDTFFINKQFKMKDTFEGYQFVKYKDGDYGVLHKSIVIRPRQNQKVAYPYQNVYEKGIEQDVRRTFEYLKKKHLGITQDRSHSLRPLELKANQQIIAKIDGIKKNQKSGIAELKLDTGKKKLIMRIRSDYVRNLKVGREIGIVQKGEGITINLLAIKKNLSLKR